MKFTTNMETRKLEVVGLTRVEAEIYINLLDLGQAQAGNISRRTGIHRRSVYDALERLIKKGLVSFIKLNNKRYYLPTDPKRILELAEEKKQVIEGIMPEMESKFNSVKEKQETMFYKGREGLKTIFEDQLNERKEVLVFGGALNASEMIKYFFPRYTKERIRRKVKLKIIYAQRKEGITVPFSEIRYLPPKYHSPIATNIYSDKVAIIHWTEPLLAILIKNKDIAEAYRKYFNLLWGIAKPG
ncbi:hypothetical protein HY643_01330 [Candidatus Woesearchaeota archaeon]|nr:hypothetical protein [Candidatus Woesearchaeota archaeon]